METYLVTNYNVSTMESSAGIRMDSEFLNTLQESVDSICDQLYAEKTLITAQAVKKALLAHGAWSDADLDQIPGYINGWRLQNLQSQDTDLSPESIDHLKAQLQKYHHDLLMAQQTINHLKSELLTKTNDIKILRFNIIKELRGLLGPVDISTTPGRNVNRP